MKNILASLAGAAILLVTLPSHATTITANYSVDANAGSNGLAIETQDIAPNPFSFDLNQGEHEHFTLFSIWTDEAAVNSDDMVAQPIKVNFGFTLPAAINGSVGGTTVGESALLGWYQAGQVTWNGPQDFFFGPNDLGHIRVTLSDATFNQGVWWGLGNIGAHVHATVKLIQDVPADVMRTYAATVPEPSVLALFALAILALAFLPLERKED